MRLTWMLIGAACLLSACGGGDEATTITVPGDHATIQEAVDAAARGDLILIEPGTYHEQVIVETEDLVIRGLDRNGVVLDGEDELYDGFLVVADGVAIENLTVQRYAQNGILFTGQVGYDAGDGNVDPGDPLERYRVSSVTASNNGTYGIYAFASRGGVIEDSYASGHPDSGFYVGQCNPCDVVLRNVTAERNAIGYFGTNASGGVYVIESTFRENRLGMTPNSQVAELLAPQQGAVIAGNLVLDNDSPDAPAIARGFFGGGIAVGGGVDNQILRNRVEGHEAFGIGLIPLDGFAAADNVVEGNVVIGNGVDIVVDTDGRANGNCFADNEFKTEQPPGVAAALDCSGPGGASLEALPFPAPRAAPDVDYRNIAKPGPQPTMTDPTNAPAPPAGEPPKIDIDTISVPAR